MKKISFLLLALLAGNFAQAQIATDTVDVTLNMKHIVGSQSSFDRNKYLIIHDDLTGKEWESDEMKKSFLEDNDVYFGRNNGYIVWEYNNTKEDPNKAGWPDIDYMKTRGAQSRNAYASESFVHQFENRYSLMMVGGQEHMFPHGQATSKGGLVYSGFEATAEFYANYLKEFFGDGGNSGRPRPKMLEVINEPFVKASSLGTTNAQISEYHNVVAKRVKELNPDIMVGGYTAAHPAFEANNFAHWNNNWKTFIDIAGANMDFFSFHLYDVTLDGDLNGTKTKRAGANIEAIMDMINHYSVLKMGKVKPFAISEFGWFCKDYKGNYDPLIDWYNIRSFNNMMLQIMQRPEQVINAIPFVLLKALWAKPTGAEYNNYQSRLLREIGELPGETPHGGYVYTDIIKFFEFWRDVKGTRIDTKASDFDLLSDAYVDGNNLYLIFSNLNSVDRKIRTKFYQAGSSAVQSVEIKHLYLDQDRAKLEISNPDLPLGDLEIKSEASMIVKYTFDQALAITETNTEKDYYADKYLQAIVAGSEQTYQINNISVNEQGEAILRLGLGRNHGLSLHPVVKVNGQQVEVPGDWRGYDQENRDSFFGVIEIPVPYDILQANNTVTVRFTDGGGYVSSVILKVFNMSAPVQRSGFNYENSYTVGIADQVQGELKVYPNPAQNFLKIENPFQKGIAYSIYNIKGAVVKNGRLENSNNTVGIRDLRNGMYILRLQGSKYQSSVKFIKNM